MTDDPGATIDSLPPLAQARRLLPLAEQALPLWERWAADQAWLREHDPDSVDAPRRALALARSLLAAGAAPQPDELAALSCQIQAAGERASENLHTCELAFEASAAVAVVATPLALALAAIAPQLAAELTWEVEADPAFALHAADVLQGLDPRLDELLAELTDS